MYSEFDGSYAYMIKEDNDFKDTGVFGTMCEIFKCLFISIISYTPFILYVLVKYGGN